MEEQPPFDPAIADFYRQAAEEARLEQGASLLEALRTRELIQRFAPPAPAVVFDIGGAAGAYALWLAELGYTVHLIDAVPRLVEEAQRRSAASVRPLASCAVGDARATTVAGCVGGCRPHARPAVSLDRGRRSSARASGSGADPQARRTTVRRGDLTLGVRAGWPRARPVSGSGIRRDRRARHPRGTASQPDAAARLLHDGIFPSSGRAPRRGAERRLVG